MLSQLSLQRQLRLIHCARKRSVTTVSAQYDWQSYCLHRPPRLRPELLPHTSHFLSSVALSKQEIVPPNVIYRRKHSRATRQPLRGPAVEDVSYFRSILSRPDRSILTNLVSTRDETTSFEEASDELARYNQDWTKLFQGSSPLVLRPQSSNEVSSILSYCNDHLIGIVPQGGNTGLCGGATPLTNEIILSLEDMNRIHHLDLHSGILQCDAGCILQHLHEYVNERGYLLPLDIGSKGTCQLGGNVSTNAGGQYFFRFGGLHGTVMGLEVVLPNGEVLHLNMDSGNDNEGDAKQQKGGRSGSHRKDNTGYDLKHLFIGAEGTLGIVTKVAIACPALPKSKNAALLVCNSYQDVLGVLEMAKDELGEILSAMELIDWQTLQMVREYGVGASNSSSGGARLLQEILASNISPEHQNDSSNPLYLLVETQGSNAEHDNSKMDSFLTRLFESSVVENGFIAQDAKQMMEMWNIRESCNPSVARAGCVYKFDVSVPIEEYMDVAYEVERKLESTLKHKNPEFADGLTSPSPVVCVWGHIADGNAHINIVTPGQFEKDKNLAKDIETLVYESVLQRKGSISAEHGLGQSKNEYLGQIKEKGVLDVMASVKDLFDPNGIMNPNKYLP